MPHQRVLFLHGLTPETLEIVLSCAPPGFKTIPLARNTPVAEQVAAARDADFLMVYRAPLPPDVAHAARGAKLVQLLAAGYDDIDVRLLHELRLPCANNGGANSCAVADHTVLAILALYRQLAAAERSVRAGTWNAPISGTNTFELAGKVVGLFGFGNIAKQVAKRVQAFDATVQYHCRTPLPPPEEERLNARWVDLPTLFSTSDILSLHAPLVKSTRNVVSRERLATMRRNAILVNTSRGAMVDEKALFDALRDGRIAGAGLDAFVQEPVDPANPLLKLPNVVATPHSAGTTADTWRRRGEFAFANMQRVAAGEQALSQVHHAE